jgi:nucleoside-diphosphate-sugar epimerase
MSANGAAREHLQEQFHSVDVVINAAGLAVPDSRDTTQLMTCNAVLPGIVAAVAANAGVRRLVHISSAAVQGRRDPLDETHEVAPLNSYARSKAEGERVLCAGSLARPPELVVHRPTSVQHASRAITQRLAAVALWRRVPVPGTGKRPVPVCLVENVARAVAHVASAESAPPISLQPWEGMTTRRLLDAFGATTVTIPVPHRLVRAAFGIAGLSRGFGPIARRAEILLLGQGQDARSLKALGFESGDCFGQYVALGNELRRHPPQA